MGGLDAPYGSVFAANINVNIDINFVFNITGIIAGMWESVCINGNICPTISNRITITNEMLTNATKGDGQIASIYKITGGKNLNNTRIVFENTSSVVQLSKPFSLFEGYNYFYNISVQAPNLQFSGSDVGLLFDYTGDKPVVLSNIHMSAYINSTETVSLLSRQAQKSVSITKALVNMTELNSSKGAQLLFATAQNAAINITEMNVTNSTSLHGMGQFAGLITAMTDSSVNVTSSIFEYSVSQEDTSSGHSVLAAPIVKSSTNGTYSTTDSTYRIRGVYLLDGCTGNCTGMPELERAKVVIDGTSASTGGCVLASGTDYNSTDIEIHAVQIPHSIFCSAPLLYNISVRGKSNTGDPYANVMNNNTTTNALLVAQTDGTTLANVVVEKVKLSVAGGGILVGKSTGHVNMRNVTVDADLDCSSTVEHCGGLVGTLGAASNLQAVNYTGIVTSQNYVAGLVGDSNDVSVSGNGITVYASVSSVNALSARGLCGSSKSTSE